MLLLSVVAFVFDVVLVVIVRVVVVVAVVVVVVVIATVVLHGLRPREHVIHILLGLQVLICMVSRIHLKAVHPTPLL